MNNEDKLPIITWAELKYLERSPYRYGLIHLVVKDKKIYELRLEKGTYDVVFFKRRDKPNLKHRFKRMYYAFLELIGYLKKISTIIKEGSYENE